MADIWVIDDDRSVRFVLAEGLREAGYSVREFEGARTALAALAGGAPSLVFTDVRMPEIDGLALLDALKERRPDLPVVVMSAYTDISSTAGAFRGGAHDFLSKPFDIDAAVAMATRGLKSRQSSAPVAGDAPLDSDLVGESPAMRELFRAVGRLAHAPLAVLITGETGTGKELVARALHSHSARSDRPFVALNTAAIPAELLESELFGHEAGAFTGAARRHTGRFEQAHGGTLFLDEIGDMPLSLQTRLLRVLAEGEFFRVGGRELIHVDVRVIAATHQDLDTLAASGHFRADLLHRLDVVRLRLPPLRERIEDVPLLAQRFLAQAVDQLGGGAKRFDRGALAKLQAHSWPGNVRELENVCWRLAALAPGETILPSDLPDALGRSTAPTMATASTQGATDRLQAEAADDWESVLKRWANQQLAAGVEPLYPDALARFQRTLMECALTATDGHRQEAARRLGMGRNTLTRKLGSSRRRKS